MIIFRKIKYKNLMGVGNSPVEILLDKSKTTLIVGEMGSGKSSILDSISLGLFGKPFRAIKKNQLINTINGKHCVVEIWFDIGPKKYYVRRGIKPDIFEIQCDGVLIEQVADARQHQRVLEDQILQMTPRTFNQVVLLSTTNFRPFMQLDAKDRREVIEDILDIHVFSAMNQVLAKKNTSLKENISIINGNIEVQRQKVEIQKKYIETLNLDQEAKKNELISLVDASTNKITQLEKIVAGYTDEINSLDSTITDAPEVKQKRTKLSPILSPLQTRIGKLEDNIAFYEQTNVCPSCHQEIEPHIKETHITTTTNKIEEIKGAINKLSAQLDDIRTRELEINTVMQKIYELTNNVQTINNQIIAEQNYIRKLNSELNGITKITGSIDSERETLHNMTEGTSNLILQKSALSESKQYLDIAATLLKDSGIKTKIIEQYLPMMNKFINRYLEVMELWVSFHLDGEFNETIKSRYRDSFTYDSFSEGEKQRIDLAILFTWRAIAKMKNSVSCNLLFFDEVVDKSLSVAGTEYVVQLLDSLGADTNVFVISHKVQELQEKFQSVIKFEKVNNFSQLAVTT